MIEMKVTRFALDPVTEMPIVILEDSEGTHAVPVWIGLVEAGAVVADLERIEIDRPLTHDLFIQLASRLGATIDHVEINSLRNNTYYSTVVIVHDGEEMRLTARSSDALAISMRAECPILVEEEVVARAREMSMRGSMDSLQTVPTSEELLALLPDGSFGKWKM